MVKCRVCGKRKNIQSFYPRQVRANGLVGECKSCTRKRVRDNRQAKIDYYRKYDADRFQNDPRVKARHRRYNSTKAGKLSSAKARQKWLYNNQEKRAAHVLVGNAVRDGRLEKPDTCQICGAKPGRIEGHHEDYSKPLEVMWLCRSCHTAQHRMAAE